MMQVHSVLFLHIPKTAGTTLRTIVGRQFQAREVYTISQNPVDSIAEFRQRPQQSWPDTRLLQGHMSFGLHRFMTPPFTYISMMRDPVKRVLSDYHFVTSNKAHPLYPHVKDMCLSEYVQSGITGQLSNGQTRLLSGECENQNYGIPSLQPIDENHFIQAKQNIDQHFALVGLQERFLESLLLLQKALGWSTPFHIKENMTKRPYHSDDIDKNDIEIIRNLNQFDMEIYAHVEEKFNQAIADYGPSFSRDLAKFRILNNAYRPLAQLSPGRVKLRAKRFARRLMSK